MQRNEILLDCRYGRKNKLVHIKDNLWELVPEYKNLSVRCGLVAEGKSFIDPEAGPMIIEKERLPAIDYEANVVSIKDLIVELDK